MLRIIPRQFFRIIPFIMTTPEGRKTLQGAGENLCPLGAADTLCHLQKLCDSSDVCSDVEGDLSLGIYPDNMIGLRLRLRGEDQARPLEIRTSTVPTLR